MSTETGLVGAAGKGQTTGSPLNPTAVQGSDGVDAERLATFAAQTDGSAKTQTTRVLSSVGPTPIAPKTVPTGAAEPIVGGSTPATRYVRVTSDFANTKTVYVSGAGVTVVNGQPLGPGDVYTNNEIDNANLLYCISADAAQVLRIEVL